MAKRAYIGVEGVARKIKKAYIGIDGVARKVKKAYIGVDGIAQPCWSGSVKVTISVGSYVSRVYYYVTEVDGTRWNGNTMFTTTIEVGEGASISWSPTPRSSYQGTGYKMNTYQSYTSSIKQDMTVYFSAYSYTIYYTIDFSVYSKTPLGSTASYRMYYYVNGVPTSGTPQAMNVEHTAPDILTTDVERVHFVFNRCKYGDVIKVLTVLYDPDGANQESYTLTKNTEVTVTSDASYYLTV